MGAATHQCSPPAPQTLEDLAYVASVTGRYVEAAELLDEALAIKRRVLEPGSLALPKLELELATQLKNAGRRGEAAGCAERARAAYAEQLGPDDARTAAAAAMHMDLVGARPPLSPTTSTGRSFNHYVLDVSNMTCALAPSPAASARGERTPSSPGGGLAHAAAQRLLAASGVSPRTAGARRTSSQKGRPRRSGSGLSTPSDSPRPNMEQSAAGDGELAQWTGDGVNPGTDWGNHLAQDTMA